MLLDSGLALGDTDPGNSTNALEEHVMKARLASVLGTMAMLLLISGCANRATGSLTPGADLSGIKNYYVVQQPKDTHGLDQLIKDGLIKRGYTATIGVEQSPPYRADAVVTYVDKWQWDITMYLLELTIVVRNPTNSFPLATGNSFHTSLTRLSPEEMVDEVLINIFAAK
jgi:hypothetical protein